MFRLNQNSRGYLSVFINNFQSKLAFHFHFLHVLFFLIFNHVGRQTYYAALFPFPLASHPASHPVLQLIGNSDWSVVDSAQLQFQSPIVEIKVNVTNFQTRSCLCVRNFKESSIVRSGLTFAISSFIYTKFPDDTCDPSMRAWCRKEVNRNNVLYILFVLSTKFLG